MFRLSCGHPSGCVFLQGYKFCWLVYAYRSCDPPVQELICNMSHMLQGVEKISGRCEGTWVFLKYGACWIPLSGYLLFTQCHYIRIFLDFNEAPTLLRTIQRNNPTDRNSTRAIVLRKLFCFRTGYLFFQPIATSMTCYRYVPLQLETSIPTRAYRSVTFTSL